MNNAVWSIGSLLFSCWVAVQVLHPFDIQYLTNEQLQVIKQDKLFWEWDSPYGNIEMHYIEKGEGPEHVLLLHGFRGHSYTWKKMIEPLAAAGYHVWAVDMIGFGLSGKPDNVPYDYHFFVDQMQAFMEAKKIQNVHLIGNSMGGGLALSLALDQPERIKSLTLISALGYPLELPFYFTISTHLSNIYKPFLGSSMVRNGLKRLVYDQNQITDEQIEAYSMPFRLHGGVEASIATLHNFDNHRLEEMSKQYSFMNCPVLVIWGDHDTLIPLTHYENFLKDFPTSDSCLIPECGHLPQEEKSNDVLAAIFPFLEKNVIGPEHMN